MLKSVIKSLTTACLVSSCAVAEPHEILRPDATPQASESPKSSVNAAPIELPVREVACFKDGHAFVVREGTRKLDAQGRTVLEQLPVPVLGTFWPYATGSARLVSVVASTEKVTREQTATQLREMLEGNVGADVIVYDTNNERIEGQLVGVPAVAALDRPGDDVYGSAPVPGRDNGRLVLIRVAEGLRAMPIERVRDVTIKGQDARTFRSEESVDRLTLRVENGGSEAVIGLAYVQKGLRWIPAYKIDLDGNGNALVKMEATLVNDLIDLEDVTVNLVVGVPHFEFQGQIDPIALQRTVVEFGRWAEPTGPSLSNRLSNAIMTQAGSYRGPGDTIPPGGSQSPALEGAQSNEDLFVYTVKHITLKRGERMVLPVADFALKYRDVYTLDADIEPPFDIQAQIGRNGTRANLEAGARAVHAARLQNDSKFPLTTSPCLVLASGRVLAQSLLTYTPVGASTDLELTTAIDIGVEMDSNETARKPNVEEWNGRNYGRIDMAGTIDLTNHKSQALDVEVRQLVLGRADSVGAGGKMQQKNAAQVWNLPNRPRWWESWNWPYWWFRFNGVAEIKWTVHLEPGKSAKLESVWHYYWE